MVKNNVKKATICPNCGKLISVNSESCFYCGLKNPGRFGLQSLIQRLFRNLGFIQAVIYFCIGMYVVSLILTLLIEPDSLFQTSGFMRILSPGSKSLVVLGMTGFHSMFANHYWTVVTAIYLHGGLLHILFNMLWIRQLGPMVENIYGTSRLILIFTFSGVFGFILSNAISGAPTIGASGSIFGLLGALIYYGRARGGIFRQVVYPQILTWAIVLFLFGFFFPGVNNYAHLGGFVGGYLSANLLSFQERRVETAVHRKAAAVVIGITILAFALSLLSAQTSLKLFF